MVVDEMRSARLRSVKGLGALLAQVFPLIDDVLHLVASKLFLDRRGKRIMLVRYVVVLIGRPFLFDFIGGECETRPIVGQVILRNVLFFEGGIELLLASVHLVHNLTQIL